MDVTTESLPSSSRAMRNLAEKQRRDKLNSYIGELAALVPVVSAATRKLDKTSVLRLSANYLRIHQNIDLPSPGEMRQAPQRAAQYGHMILDSLEAFLIVISSSGKVVYVSSGVEKALGYSQVDMMGIPIYCFVHPEDHLVIRRHLTGALEAQASRNEFQCGNKRRCVFECRIASRPVARGEPANYERVQVTGQFRSGTARKTTEVPVVPAECAKPRRGRNGHGRSSTSSKANNENAGEVPGSCEPETLLVALMRVTSVQPLATSMTIIDSLQDQYITRHLPDGRIVNTDHRISVIAGYFTEEVQGKSAFGFIYSEDLQFTLMRFKQMSGDPSGEGSTTYRLVSRTGKLIYLRSRGFLEFHPVTKEMMGFVCFNILLSEEEGEKEMSELRDSLTSIGFDSPPPVILDPEVVQTPTPSPTSSPEQWSKCPDNQQFINKISMSGGHVSEIDPQGKVDHCDFARTVVAGTASNLKSPVTPNDGSLPFVTGPASYYSCSSDEDSSSYSSRSAIADLALEPNVTDPLLCRGYGAPDSQEGYGPIRHRKSRNKYQFTGRTAASSS